MSYLISFEEQQGLVASYRRSVRVATTANVNLAATLTTLDGVSLVDGDRVLVKDQTSPIQNGIYVWTSGTQLLTRANDFQNTVFSGQIVTVQEGTEFQDSLFMLTSDGPLTVGVAGLAFEEVQSGFHVRRPLTASQQLAFFPDGITVLSTISINPLESPNADLFFFGAVFAVSDGAITGRLRLYDLDNTEYVTGAVLTLAGTTNQTEVESAALTVGSAAGNLKDSNTVYQVHADITAGGVDATDIVIVGSTYLRVK